MSYAGYLRKLEASQRREERDAKKRQRELQKRLKERQKLSELETARLEVDAFLNAVEVLLSVHKESARPFDWAACAFALPPAPPLDPAKVRWLHGLKFQLQPPVSLVESSRFVDPAIRLTLELPATVEEAEQLDAADHSKALEEYQRDGAEWLEMRNLGRRILAGERDSYTEAIAEYSSLSELATLGSAIHFSVHHAKSLEFSIIVKGRDIIPADVKSLTASGKLSVKAMPKGKFQETYQDYVCGCVLRVAREVFALLPVDTLLGNARVPTLDRATGLEREMAVLSVILPREQFMKLDFNRLDPSDTIEGFRHRGSAKVNRSTAEFQEIIPLTLGTMPSSDGDADSLSELMAQLQSAREVLSRFTRNKLSKAAGETTATSQPQ